MRPRSPAVVRYSLLACALIAALALSACGSETSATPGQGDASGQEVTTTATQPSQSTPAKPKGRAGGSPCQAQLGDFLDSLDRLRTRLAAGLSYQQYAAAIKDLRATYDDLPAATLPPDCLVAAGTSAEKAFNRYIEAANTWGECLADAGCNSEVVEPELQREWQVASHWLSEAHAGLKRIS